MYPNLMQAFDRHVIEQPDAVVFRYKVNGEFVTMSYRQAYEKVEAIASWLKANGIGNVDPICIIYTSGTTGPPKGVVLTHGNIAI